jgi:hypothetical protein
MKLFVYCDSLTNMYLFPSAHIAPKVQNGITSNIFSYDAT